MKNKNLVGLIGLPLVALGIIGGTAFASTGSTTQTASAQTPAAQVATTVVAHADTTADTEKVDTDKEVPDAQEQQMLAVNANITTEQASKNAIAKIGGGTVSSIKLSDEDNNLVYEVVVGAKEVKVSATDGRILEVDAHDGEGHDKGETGDDVESN